MTTVADASRSLIAASQPAGQPEPPQNVLTADFETFLTLLTTQLQFQDPLEPTDSTEFVAQLAQFSTVEQSVQQSATLEGILAAVGGSGVGRFADWLGREVRTPDGVRVEGGEPVELFPPAGPAGARTAVMEIRGPGGVLVREAPFTPGDSLVVWDGLRAQGDAATPGVYQFQARFTDGAGEETTAPVEAWGRVVEVTENGEDALLRLDGGATADASAVTGLRLAGG